MSAARRRLLVGLAVIAAFLLGWISGEWRRGSPPPPEAAPAVEPAPPPEDRAELTPVRFSDLPGWREGSARSVLPALGRSCEVLLRSPADEPLSLGAERVGGTAGAWGSVCRRLPRAGSADEETVWSFFETHFEPFAVTNRGEPEGLFTGYYEPTLDGSRVRTERFSVPLYGRPPELLTVDLGRFREEWRGERLAGRLEGAAVVPFADRRAIHRGALAGRRLEVLWVDDPVDAFFLEIQGSGRVRLPDGEEVRVGYAGQNGHPYTAIGRVLVERGALPRQAVSLQSIRRWLEDHPQWARDLLERNASYVFFRILDGDGPRGAQGVVLSPGRSLAVDRRFLPLGAPVWLTTTVPGPAQGTPEEPFRRLLVTQDTGGAIRGPVRGDVFFGPGEEAAWRAGHLKRPGRLWLLLPRGAATAGGS